MISSIYFKYLIADSNNLKYAPKFTVPIHYSKALLFKTTLNLSGTSKAVRAKPITKMCNQMTRSE